MFSVRLKEGESLLYMYRQAEIKLLWPTFVILIALYAPIAFLLKYDLLANFLNILLIWSIFIVIYFLRSYLAWLLNCYIITSERVITIKYFGIFKKVISEAQLLEIVQIKQVTKGVFQTFFGLGDLQIYALGIKEPFEMLNLRNVEVVKNLLFKNIGQRKIIQSKYSEKIYNTSVEKFE